MKTIIEGIQIKAITSWLPESRLDLTSLSNLYGETEVDRIIKTTGIKEVRVVDKGMTSSDMCQKAAEYLLEKEKIDKNNIDGLVFVSQTCDYILPATSISLQHRLGLTKNTVCIDIHYGCSGYIYGLFQAASWINCGACKNVLVLAGDTTTRMVNENDKSLRMVFGDCGTATLVTKGTELFGVEIQSDGSGTEKLIIPAGGFRYPISGETSVLEWDADHNGRTKNDLYMDGMAIFSFAITKVHKIIDDLIETMNWNKEDVGLYALHQANSFMVNYIRKKLKVSETIVPLNCEKYGNTGPATIPLLLCDICSDNTNTYKLDKVVMCGFGVGLSLGTITTNLKKTTFYKPLNK